MTNGSSSDLGRRVMPRVERSHGSWKMICMSRRNGSQLAPRQRAEVAALRSGLARRRLGSGAAALRPGSTCRSRTRRPGRASSPARDREARRRRPRARSPRPAQEDAAAHGKVVAQVCELRAAARHARQLPPAGGSATSCSGRSGSSARHRRLRRSVDRREAAAVREAAAGRQIARSAGTVPSMAASRDFAAGVERRDRREQAARVGMARRREQLVAPARARRPAPRTSRAPRRRSRRPRRGRG